MKTFTDNAGRTWTIAINVGAVKRVRGLLDVDLLEAVEGRLLERLVSDPVLLCDVIYALCKPEADPRNISDEEFGRAMGGDAIDGATAALLSELVDFFPKGRRGVLRKALDKLETLQQRVIDHATRRIESDEIDRLIEKELDGLPTSGGIPTASPASPASSPTG
jgi:hypothetical protein